MPSIDSPSHEAASHPWWTKAVLVAATGYVFSLLLAALLSIGLMLNAPLTRTWERAGIDFGMRIFVAFGMELDPALHEQATEPKHLPPIVFIDVDEQACRAFRPSDGNACRVNKPVPTALVVDFMKAMRKSAPAVVVVDVAPPDDATERSQLQAALLAEDGPWVIAPAYSRPAANGDQFALSGDPTREILPARATGRLRIASVATSSDPEAGDGIVRRFPMVSRLSDPDGTVRWLPSAPYLAAMLASPDKAFSTDCAFYGRNCARASTRSPLQFDPRKVDPRRNGAPRNRIFYSLPSLVDRGDLQDTLDWRYRNVYRHRPAYAYLNDGHFIPDDELAGTIVVLGSSMASAKDIHPSPIGTLSGAEISINAMRAFGDFAPLVEVEHEGWANRIAGTARSIMVKWAGASRGAIVLLPFWLAIFGLLSWSRGKSPIIRFGARIAVPLLFFAGMGISALFELRGLAGELHESITLGHPVDVLTPLIGLGLEAYSEAASLITRNVERLLESLAHRTHSALAEWDLADKFGRFRSATGAAWRAASFHVFTIARRIGERLKAKQAPDPDGTESTLAEEALRD